MLAQVLIYVNIKNQPIKLLRIPRCAVSFKDFTAQTYNTLKFPPSPILVTRTD